MSNRPVLGMTFLLDTFVSFLHLALLVRNGPIYDGFNENFRVARTMYWFLLFFVCKQRSIAPKCSRFTLHNTRICVLFNWFLFYFAVYVVLGNYYDHTGLVVAMDEMDLFKNGMWDEF